MVSSPESPQSLSCLALSDPARGSATSCATLRQASPADAGCDGLGLRVPLRDPDPAAVSGMRPAGAAFRPPAHPNHDSPASAAKNPGGLPPRGSSRDRSQSGGSGQRSGRQPVRDCSGLTPPASIEPALAVASGARRFATPSHRPHSRPEPLHPDRRPPPRSPARRRPLQT